MKKDLAIIFGLFLFIVVLLVFGRGFTSAIFLVPQQGTPSASAKKGHVNLTVRDLSVNAKVVSKVSDRQRGLSKAKSLPLNEGMLFVFEENGIYPFWMKDMNFAIDIIWIGENKRIVYIASNVPPEPGKKDKELMLYRPDSDSRYVLEINAGLAQLHGVQVGDTVNFDL